MFYPSLSMLQNYFIRNSLENVGSSFVFGTLTKLTYKVFQEYPDLYTLNECVLNGIDMSKYTLIHCINSYLLDLVGMRGYLLRMCSVFISGFCVGMRSGTQFAVNNGMMGLFFSVVKDFIKPF